MVFAQTALASKNNVDVLFIMTIDPNKLSVSTKPYATIDEYTKYNQE